MPRVISQLPAFLLTLACFVPLVPSYACLRTQDNKPKLPNAKSAPTANPFIDVPLDSPYYSDLDDLLQGGFVSARIVKRTRGRLTRYEFAVCTLNAIGAMTVRTLAKHGKQLEPTFGIPNNLDVLHARGMLELCNEFQPELLAIGVKAGTQKHIRQTLEVFLRPVPVVPFAQSRPANSK